MKILILLCCCFMITLSAEEVTGVVSIEKKQTYITSKDNIKYKLTGGKWRDQVKEWLGGDVVVSCTIKEEKKGKVLKNITALKLIGDAPTGNVVTDSKKKSKKKSQKKSSEQEEKSAPKEEKGAPQEDEYESDF